MGMILRIRQGVLGATMLFSLIVLAMSAHLISLALQYCGIAVATAVISLLTLPVMLVVDIFRRGAFTSMIAVELGWLSVLWILWVATAGEAVAGYNLNFPYGCYSVYTIADGSCPGTQAIAAFSFLNFIIILFYIGFLSVMTVIAASRGRKVWLLSVEEAFGALTGPMEHPLTQYNASVLPQSQIAHPQHTTNLTQPASPSIMV